MARSPSPPNERDRGLAAIPILITSCVGCSGEAEHQRQYEVILAHNQTCSQIFRAAAITALCTQMMRAAASPHPSPQGSLPDLMPDLH